MKTQTIEVEGLPEGYRGVSINIPTYGQSYWNGHNVCVAGTSTPGYAYLIIEKIQPLRIVLEETSDYNKEYYSGLYETQVFSNGLRLRNQKHVWREVKETDIPLTNEDSNVKMGVNQGDGDDQKLELSVDECKEAMRKLETFNVTDLSVKICRFLKKDK